jgi:hypothetical protein
MNVPLVEFFDRFLPAPSFDAWRDILRQSTGQPPLDRARWARMTGDRSLLTAPPSTIVLAAARGSGKSQVMGIIALHKALTHRRPHWFSQRPFALFLGGTDQRQAEATLDYPRQLLESPHLRSVVAGDLTKRVITLRNGVRLEVVPAEGAKLRSRGAVCVVADELGYYPPDDASELLAAVYPLLGRIPGSVFLVGSTKGAPRGAFYDLWKRSYGVNDPDVLVVDADIATLNPTYDRKAVERRFREDPAMAMSEYGRDGHTEWRSDTTCLFRPEALAACIEPGVRERPPQPGIVYRAFVDLASGSADSAVLAIGHTQRIDSVSIEVLDLLLEIQPPYNPVSACADFASVLRRYGLTSATSDAWAASFAVEAFRRHGITLEQTALSKTQIYTLALSAVNSEIVALLDDPRFVYQATMLSRQAEGRIDHPRSGHDDRVNCAFGVLTLPLAQPTPQYRVSIL